MKAAATVLLLSLALPGCSSLQYYWQSVAGHMELMRAARPLEEWLADPNADAALKARLILARRLREFAVAQLHLPDNASYRRYADIGRPWAVWNLVAAPELSLKAKTWCFPVAGCVAYRGYFVEADARTEAAALRQDGLEVNVYGVPAYSTLGWMNWAGGDPLLSSFVNQAESELARLLFHEMAHQVVYVKDDTSFNESFATAVEQIGLRQWRAASALNTAPGGLDLRQQAAQDALAQERRLQFRALALAAREELARIYASVQTRAQEPGVRPPAGSPGQGSDIDAARAAKQEAMDRLRQRYLSLRSQWLQNAAQQLPVSALAQPASLLGYDRWMQGANNASLASLASYDEWVAAFERLFEREGGDWRRFYDAVRSLAASPRERRDESLRKLTKESASG